MKTKYIIIGGAVAAITGMLALQSCRSIPKGAKAVQNFDKKKYLGTWYEIARLDFTFERDLDHTTAEYSLNEDGSIKVVNRGHNYKTGNMKEAVGKAKFVGADTEAKLKVSFFGPFYAGYNVLAIDEDYQYALVAGKNLKYLWILSRKKTIPENVKENYLAIAQNLGYQTADLLWVNQD